MARVAAQGGSAGAGFSLTPTSVILNPPLERGRGHFARFLPVEVEWEAKPEFNNLSDNKSPVDYVWHIMKSIGAQDGRWMPGRGLRIFPDKDTPTGQLRNKVQLKIKAASTRPDRKVFVRVYDVDDPTPTSFDFGGEVDSNGEAGGDNIGSDQDHDDFHFINGGAVSNTDVQRTANSQQYASCGVTLDSNNEATIEMQVSMQPGDNFRAAVALDPADFLAIQVTSPGEIGFLKPSSEIPQGFKGAVSDMLTVWRSLSLEFDSMATPPAGDFPLDKQTVVGLQWPSSSQVIAASLGVPDDFFESGIALVGGGQLCISTNAPSALTFSAPVDAATQALMTNHAFTIVDDDGRGLPADYSPLLPRQLPITDQLRARFVTSYIELRDVGSLNTSTEVPFEANAVPTLFTSMDNSRNVEDTDGYWNHLIVAAYQALEGEDRDPNSEEYTMGATNPWTPKRSAIYLETIRDQYHLGLNTTESPAVQALNQVWYRRDVQGCIAHETAHAPSGFFDDHHSEGGLIGAGEVDIDTHVFKPITVRRFRKTLSWGGQP